MGASTNERARTRCVEAGMEMQAYRAVIGWYLGELLRLANELGIYRWRYEREP